VLEGTGEIDDVGSGDGEILNIVQDGPNDIKIDVTSSQDAWLVLADTWYPGWRAAVDGEATEVLHANFLFRAVRVPAGVHEITFAYRPVSAVVGSSLSGLGLLALVGMAWLWRRD
jgi:uncharacterized membrane protein YfhO